MRKRRSAINRWMNGSRSAGMSTVMDCFLFVEDWLGSSLGLDMRACNSFVNGADLQIHPRLSLNALFG